MSFFPHRILVVDDNQTNRELLERILKAEDCSVGQAATGEECFAALGNHHYDLVLLDVLLPDANGRDLCARIKGDPANADLLVILLSGNLISSEEQAIGLEIGADDYIPRPFDKRELVARVRAVYRLRESIRALRPKPQHTDETARIFDQGSLRESHPAYFDRASTQYRGLVEDAIYRRIHKVDTHSGDQVRGFATDMGFARAGARDIIDIHTQTLADIASGGSAKRALLLQEESRVLLIEVMGHVLNNYRLRS